jgi:hypothetical protein
MTGIKLRALRLLPAIVAWAAPAIAIQPGDCPAQHMPACAGPFYVAVPGAAFYTAPPDSGGPAAPPAWSAPAAPGFLPLRALDDDNDDLLHVAAIGDPRADYHVRKCDVLCWPSRLVIRIPPPASDSQAIKAAPRNPHRTAAPAHRDCGVLPVLDVPDLAAGHDPWGTDQQWLVLAHDCLRGTAVAHTLVLVVDTSASMGGHIAEVADEVRALLTRVQQPPSRPLRVGLIAFQDNKHAPGSAAAYVAKWIREPEPEPESDISPNSIAERLRALADETSRTAGIQEDALAAIALVLEDPSVDGGDVLLITDAGAREGSDPLSATGMSLADAARELENRHIRLHALHLGTRTGSPDAKGAREQYIALSSATAGSYLEHAAAVPDLAGGLLERIAPRSAEPGTPGPVPGTRLVALGDIARAVGLPADIGLALSERELEDLAGLLRRITEALTANRRDTSPFYDAPYPLMPNALSRIPYSMLAPDYLPQPGALPEPPKPLDLHSLPSRWQGKRADRENAISLIEHRLATYRNKLCTRSDYFEMHAQIPEFGWFLLKPEELP